MLKKLKKKGDNMKITCGNNRILNRVDFDTHGLYWLVANDTGDKVAMFSCFNLKDANRQFADTSSYIQDNYHIEQIAHDEASLPHYGSLRRLIDDLELDEKYPAEADSIEEGARVYITYCPDAPELVGTEVNVTDVYESLDYNGRINFIQVNVLTIPGRNKYELIYDENDTIGIYIN